MYIIIAMSWMECESLIRVVLCCLQYYCCSKLYLPITDFKWRLSLSWSSLLSPRTSKPSPFKISFILITVNRSIKIPSVFFGRPFIVVSSSPAVLASSAGMHCLLSCNDWGHWNQPWLLVGLLLILPSASISSWFTTCYPNAEKGTVFLWSNNTVPTSCLLVIACEPHMLSSSVSQS